MVGKLPGSPKTGGRRRGSLDKAARALITEQVAKDILTVYRRLGGVKFLLEWAQNNPSEFVRQGLARMMPAFPKEDPDVLVNQLNLGNVSDFDAARHIAFAMAKAADAMGQDPVAEREPYAHLARENITPQEACRADALDPQRAEFFREVQQTPEERLASESLDERCSRVASAATRPAWMDEPIKSGRPFVGVPRSKRDLL